MLEIGIIICLAGVLFLALKNFSKTNVELDATTTSEGKGKKDWFALFRKFSVKKAKPEKIGEAILDDQDDVVAPSEIKNAQKVYMTDNPEVAKLLLEAEDFLEKNDLREAEELAISAISIEKKCSEAYVVVGKVAAVRGAFEDSKEAFKTALKCNAESGEAFFGLGQLELRNENYSSAIEYLQKAVNISRGEPVWCATLGKAYMEVRQFARAAKALKRAASLDIDNKEYKELASEAEDKQRAHASVFRR